MPLQLKPRQTSPLPPFTFSPPSSPTSPPANPPRPPADLFPENDMYMFGSQPLKGTNEPGRGLVKCVRCGKVTMEWSVAEHKRICAHVLDGAPLTNKKSTKAEKGVKPDLSKKRRASEVSSSSTSPSKKRPKLPETVTEESDSMPLSYKGLTKSEIKRIQKEKLRIEKKEAKEREKMEIAERKRQRASGPVDYDRQCGVINDKELPCSRSLTCKTHNVGAKRAVEGRTRPYDILYLEWQRANNPNFKEPPSKKDRDLRKAEKRASDKAGRNTLTSNLKKRKLFSGYGEDGEIEFDGEDGQRELEDLIHVTRIAGERLGCRSGMGRPGAWSGITGIGMGLEMGGGGHRQGGTWKGSPTFEFAQVGDLLTKALAARTKPVNPNSNPAMMPPGRGSIPPPKGLNSAQAQHRMILPVSMATVGPGPGGPGGPMAPNQQYPMVSV